MYKGFLGISTIFVLMSLSGSLIAQQSNTEKYTKFSEFTENSKLEMDFSIVDQLLHAGVMNMGPSTRAWARKQPPSTGTRFTQTVDRATENEANRFFTKISRKTRKKSLNCEKNWKLFQVLLLLINIRKRRS